MLILKFRNFRVYVNPVAAIIEMIGISYIVNSVPSVAGPGLNFLGYLVVSFLILVGLLGSLFAHEYAHFLAARWIRLPVEGITISVFGAYTSVDGEPSTPKDAFIISIAGPLMNVFIGAIFYAGYIVFPQAEIAAAVCFCLAVFNGVLGAYNLLPVMPLDGGFIVRSAFWKASRDWGRSTRISFDIGTGVVLICIVTGVINLFMRNTVAGVFFLIFGICLWQSERLAYQQMSAARFLSMVSPRHR